MSIRIYNGLILNENLLMYDLAKKCVKFQNELRDVRYVTESKELSRRFVYHYDKKFINDKLTNGMFFDYLIGEWQDISKNDYCASVIFFPLKDKILLLPFIKNKTMHDYFVTNFGVSDYCYFDNTDQPDEISEEDWRQRHSDWHEALLNGDGIPSNNGMEFTLAPKEDYKISYSDEELLKHVPTIDERGRKAATDILLKKYTNDTSDGELVSTIIGFNKRLKTDLLDEFINKKDEMSELLVDDFLTLTGL